MRILREYDGLSPFQTGAALAIGNFDGLHLGHRAVLSAMLEKAREKGAPPAVMTFEPHPRMYFTPGHPPYRIEPLHRKLRRLKLLGVEIVYLQRFNQHLSHMSADDFVSGILRDKLQVAQVITGEGFVFGHKRGGSSATLTAAARAGMFGYMPVPEVRVESEVCSSSTVRAHLFAGAMDKAARLLGRPYEITSRVRHGAARGRILGAPTANLGLHGLFLPRFGVYAVRYRTSDGLMREEGQPWCDGVANLGVRPTFNENEPCLEVHGFAESRVLYGQRLRVQLLAFLREEQKFDTPEALQAQIGRDCEQARQVLRSC